MSNNCPFPTGLSLNILEIIPSKDTIQIYSATYFDKRLNGYKDEYEPEYVFHREGNELFAWTLVKNPSKDLPNEFSARTISRLANTLVFNKVLETGIVEWFKRNQSNIHKIKYTSTWEVEYKKEIKDFKGLKVIPVFKFSVHPFYSTQTETLVTALSVNFSSKYEFDTDEGKLRAANFDTRDLRRDKTGKIIASTTNVSKFLDATGQNNDFNTHKGDLNRDDKGYAKFVELMSIFDKVIRDTIPLPDGLAITAFNFHNLPNSNFINDTATKPNYYYYQDRTGSGYYNTLVQQLKPYSFDQFKNKLIKILAITPNSHEGTTGTFTKNIEQRLKKLFHLEQTEISYLVFNPQHESYKDAVSRTDCSGFDLAIVTVSNNDKSLPLKTSPYYITKAKLLNQRIPTQEVTVEVMRRADDLIYEAIALNIYSKIGGIAWTVEKVKKEKMEVIIGISSTINFERQRILGFANIFDYNGNYLLGECSTLSTFDQYAQNLERYLTEAVKNLITSRGIGKGDSLRLIFHLSKEAGKNHEIRAIDRTLQRFKDYDIQFGIVHLSYNHNLRVFQDGGKGIPIRGTYIQVSTLQALLHLGKGTKVPILVRLDKRSTYRDLFDTCKQVLYFCHLCYRNFRPANVPVTIKYPSLMAKLTDDLNQVPNWDNSQLNRIKDKIWFI